MTSTKPQGYNFIYTPGDIFKPEDIFKPKDQNNKADGGKIRPNLLVADMPDAIKHVSAVLTYGAEKYEDKGWVNVEPQRYEDALLRHYLDFSSGEDHDNESGLHHLAHLACNAMFLLQMELDRTDHPAPKWNKPPRNHRNES